MVNAQLLKVGVGIRDLVDGFGGEVGGQAVLPELMRSLDLAFGLRGRRIFERNVMEAQRFSQRRQGIGQIAEKEAVVVHVKGQRQPVFLEGP